MKEKTLKYIKENWQFLLIILVGTIFLLIPVFHSNIWFDESYSVAIANHSFSEIWTIGSHDVHPILYYWMLKIINIIFGENIIAYRIFSTLGIVTLGILGLTHIKKDFGKTAGLLFTFFSFFLPVMLNYALEIRMYSWTIVFVSLTAIYLYRFIKQKDLKNVILFGIFSLASCYMHYYALAAAGIMNLGLIIYIIRKKEEFSADIIKKFIIVEVAQVLLYLPWFVCFVMQALRVGSGFWITIEFPQILIDLVNFQYKGSLDQLIPTIFAIALYAYILYIIIKNIRKKEKITEGLIPLGIYILVIIAMALVSKITPILYARYLFTITGLLMFTICYFLSKENNKLIIGIICGAIVIMSCNNLIENVEANYDKSNNEPIEYLKENLQDGDIMMYADMGNGGVVATKLDNTKQYFVNLGHWSIEEAYKAYAPQMGVVTTPEEAEQQSKGRIFIIDTGDLKLYNEIKNDNKYKTVSIKKFEAKYHNYTYNMFILEKNN